VIFFQLFPLLGLPEY